MVKQELTKLEDHLRLSAPKMCGWQKKGRLDCRNGYRLYNDVQCKILENSTFYKHTHTMCIHKKYTHHLIYLYIYTWNLLHICDKRNK